MFLKSIEITNFRRFEQYRASFDRHFTLLVGPNGSGKSSLLQAIYLGMLSPLQRASLSPRLDDEDVRRVDTLDPGGSKWRTPIYPVEIRLTLDVEGEEISAMQRHQGGGSPPLVSLAGGTGLRKSASFVKGIHGLMDSWLDPRGQTAAPLFARFGASNSVAGSARAIAIGPPFNDKSEIWKRAISDSVNVPALAQWFQFHELRTLQEGQAPVVYRIVRGAVLAAIHATDIKYIVRDNQLMVCHEEQGWRPFDQLSDGQRRVAAIFCELALRCASLNSHLAERCLELSSGIVTIDELDLHLHPLWQREVVTDLRRVFPQVQFIAASHSPFLLQAAFEHGQVLDVSSGEFVSPSDPSIEDIAESVMGVEHPQRGARFLELKRRAQEFYELLNEKPGNESEAAELKLRLDEALSHFANDPASAAWLEQRRTAAGL